MPTNRWSLMGWFDSFFGGGGSSSSGDSTEGSADSSGGETDGSTTGAYFTPEMMQGLQGAGLTEAEIAEVAEYAGLSNIEKDGEFTPEKYVAYGPYANYISSEDQDRYTSELLKNDINDFTGSGKHSKELSEFLKNQVALGMPLRFNANADPSDRVYSKTYFADIPLLYIIPGRAKLNEKIIDDSGKYINLNEYYETLEDGDKISWGVKKSFFGSDKDMKYVSFNENYKEFWKYVQLMTSSVYSYFILKASESGKDGGTFEMFDFSDVIGNARWKDYGIPFYYDKASTFSEDISNTYSTSRIAESVNEKSSETREIAMLGNKNGFTSIFTAVAENMKALFQGFSDSLKATLSYDYILTKTANKLVRVVNGSMLDFPEVFNDSKFDKNYNFTFKFTSPYGDRASIFKYVFVPYLTLLCFAMARQDHVLSYVEPFYIRLEAPGKCAIDMGVITSLSIVKGGSENLWTLDGLPRSIEVTMSVMDLYPSMNMVRDTKMLRYNTNLSTYLENLAGIRTDSLQDIDDELKSWLNRKLSNSWIKSLDDNIENAIGDFLYGAQEAIKDIFR